MFKKDTTKFVYKARSAETVKARGHRRVGRFDSIWKDGVEIIRLKEGDNGLRILPSTWGARDHYAYQIFVHAFVGPDNGSYLCLRKMKNEPCAICTAANRARDDGELDDAKTLQWTEKWACYVIDREDRSAKARPKVYEMGSRLDADLCALAENKKTGKVKFIDDPEEGYDVNIRRTGTSLSTRYLPQIDSDPSPIADDEKDQDDILDYISKNPLPELLFFRDADYLNKMISGNTQQKDEDADEEEDERPIRKARAIKKKEEEEPPFDEETNEENIDETIEDEIEAEETDEEVSEAGADDIEEDETEDNEEGDEEEPTETVRRSSIKKYTTNKDRIKTATKIDKQAVEKPSRLGTGPRRTIVRRTRD